MFKKIAIVADHRGEHYKQYVADVLMENGIDYCLPQYSNDENNDYPDIVKQVYKLYKTKQVDGLILLCGTGVGMAIGANKCKNIRCVWANEPSIAVFGRIHEDCNALAMPAGYSCSESQYKIEMNPQKIKTIVEAFIKTEFGGGRHARRVDKLNKI